MEDGRGYSGIDSGKSIGLAEGIRLPAEAVESNRSRPKSLDRRPDTIDGSTPTAGDFEFGTLAIPLTFLCQCLSDETLKAVGPFYLVSMPGERGGRVG